MSDNWRSDLADAQRRAQQEAYARAGIAQAEANRLQRQRDVEAGTAQVWENLRQQREQQAQELRQRQHQDIMRRLRPQQAVTSSHQDASVWEIFGRFVLLVVIVWLVSAGVRFVQARSGVTSSTQEWTQADGTRMREDRQYGMGGFIVTSDRIYPDPDQNRGISQYRNARKRPTHKIKHQRTKHLHSSRDLGSLVIAR